MKTLRQKAGSRRLINEIQLARLRLAQAEGKWELADGQAREARRRRKEAKQAARHAKKLARQAREEFTAAKEAVVALEGKFAAAVERAARNRKLARARLAVARRASKKSLPVAEISAIDRPVVKKKKLKAATVVAVPVAGEEKPSLVPGDFEKPSPGPTRVLPAASLPLTPQPPQTRRL